MPNLVQYPHDKWTIHQNKTGDDYSAATYSPSTGAVLATTDKDGRMRLHGKEVQVSEPYEREAAKAAINVLKRELADMTKQRDALAALAATRGGSHE